MSDLQRDFVLNFGGHDTAGILRISRGERPDDSFGAGSVRVVACWRWRPRRFGKRSARRPGGFFEQKFSHLVVRLGTASIRPLTPPRVGVFQSTATLDAGKDES